MGHTLTSPTAPNVLTPTSSLCYSSYERRALRHFCGSFSSQWHDQLLASANRSGSGTDSAHSLATKVRCLRGKVAIELKCARATIALTLRYKLHRAATAMPGDCAWVRHPSLDHGCVAFGLEPISTAVSPLAAAAAGSVTTSSCGLPEHSNPPTRQGLACEKPCNCNCTCKGNCNCTCKGNCNCTCKGNFNCILIVM